MTIRATLFFFLSALALSAQTASFPTALPTDVDLLSPTNRATTTLTSGVAASDLTLPVASSALFSTNELVTIDNEIVKICNTGVGTLTVCAAGRGFDNTSAVLHSSGATVRAQITAYYHKRMKVELIALATAVGINLANVQANLGLTDPVQITKGGTGASNAATSGRYLKGNGSAFVTSTLSASGIGTCGGSTWNKGNNSDAAPDCTQPAFTDISGTALTTQGGTGLTTVTGVLSGTGTAALTPVAASNTLQFLRRKANVTSTTYEFATPSYLTTTDYDFPAQTPGGSLTAGVGATVTFTPCPKGVAGANTLQYYYLQAGVGTAEAVLGTGGTCTSEAASGTIIFTPANNHSGAWTIQSASAGIRECFLVATALNGTGNPDKGCYTPSGTHRFYATLYNNNDQPVSWWGDGGYSILRQEFVGDGVIVGPAAATQNFINIHNLHMQFKDLSAYAASGSMWTFRNVADGHVTGLDAYIGYDGFTFTNSTRVRYEGLYATIKHSAFHWPLNTVGVSAGAYSNLYGSIQANGFGFLLEPTMGGLSIDNFLVEGAFAGTTGISFLPNALGSGINEVVIGNGFVDGMDNGLVANGIATAAQATGSTVHLSNIRFLSITANPTGHLKDTWKGFTVSNCLFLNAGTGDAMVISALKNSTFTGNQFGVVNAAARALVVQTYTGAEVASNLLFSGNTFGVHPSAPTGTLGTDAVAHTGIQFTGNKFGSVPGWAGTGTAVFDSTNVGLPIPVLASAATVYTGGFPVNTVSGTTQITTLSGGTKGRMLTLTFTDATPAGVGTGGNILRAVSVVQNQSIQLYFDGTNWVVVSGERNGGAGTVVAAATIALPAGDLITVTGNTGINTINTCDASTSGRRVTLMFTGTPTITDGSNLKMAGNLVATADDTLSFLCNGTNWYESGRSVN